MKLARILLAAALLATPFALPAQHSHKPTAAPHGHKAAGETHAHRAPHGGTVRTAGAYHIELVQHPTELHVYLLNGQEAPVPTQGTSGAVTLLTTTSQTSRVALVPAGDDHFVARLPAGTSLRTVLVSLRSNGKSLGARFELPGAAAKPARALGAAYACPMGCEGSAGPKPGSCPKCGMALVKKS